MSSIAMAADSTQSELMRRRKHKAKLARQSSDENSKKRYGTGCPKSSKVIGKQGKVSWHALSFYCVLWLMLFGNCVLSLKPYFITEA